MPGTLKQDEESMWLMSFTKKSTFGKWLIYIVAACLVLAASVYLFETHRTLKNLAENYIEAQYSSLDSSDNTTSLMPGIKAYNNKDYNKAVQFFESADKNNPSGSDVKKYLGISYLQTKEYDKALPQFEALTNMNTSATNAGDFLKAIALLERNNAGDKETAKKLLQKVVDEKKEDSAKAEALLKKF